jgi:hypothetical protein
MAMDEAADRLDHAPWPLRAVILAVLGAFSGLVFYHLAYGPQTEMEAALAALIAIFGIALSFSLERLRWEWSVAFAGFGAIVAAAIAWWNGSPEGWNADEGWHFASAVAAVAIAVPLFQAARDEGRLRLVPAAVHAHAWTNIILAGAAVAFVGATLLLSFLLSELFALIGVDFLRNLMRKGGFVMALACAAFGGAAGLLRDRDVVTTILQRVGRTILSVLAPVLAAGLVFFVLALPFTGLDALWEQTKATTPILIACMAGALILTNAVAGNSAEEEAKAPALRWSAMALIACLVPLALVAAISTAKRIGQHGFTPDRLWAAVFVSIALAVAVGYALALFRGRLAWPERLRVANVRLAAGICLLALFLALPILNFGALSARDQVARLENGRVSPNQFDWRALRFDFGPEGRKALRRLAGSGAYREFAAQALAADEPWAIPEPSPLPPTPARVRIDGGMAASPALMETITATRRCNGPSDFCRLVVLGPAQAVLVTAACPTCPPFPLVLERRADGRWTQRDPDGDLIASGGFDERVLESGRVEVRTLPKRQVYLDGRPVGQIFD